jgi:lipopolysaccharide export LptBFGC system permease protein LptF
MNLALGIALAFIFVFSFEILKVVAAENNSIPPLLAMWIPNIIFGFSILSLLEKSQSIEQFYFFVKKFL